MQEIRKYYKILQFKSKFDYFWQKKFLQILLLLAYDERKVSVNINNNHQQNTNFGALKKMKFTPSRYYSRDSKNILKNAFEQNKSFQEFCNPSFLKT